MSSKTLRESIFTSITKKMVSGYNLKYCIHVIDGINCCLILHTYVDSGESLDEGTVSQAG